MNICKIGWTLILIYDYEYFYHGYRLYSIALYLLIDMLYDDVSIYYALWNDVMND